MPSLVFYVDLETFWSREYTLRTMTPFAYARDSRFSLHGASVAVDLWDEGYGQFVSVMDPTWLQPGQIRGVISKVTGSKTRVSYFVCHNTLFDAVVLAARGLLREDDKFVFADTMSLARAHLLHAGVTGGSVSLAACTSGGKTSDVVNETEGVTTEELYARPELLSRVAAYCRNDVALTRGLWRKLAPITPYSELLLIDDIVRATAWPAARLDMDLLKQHHARVVSDENERLATLGVTRDEIMSTARFAELLAEFGVDVPTKISPATGQPIPALARSDEACVDLAYHPNPVVADLVDLRFRVRSTIERTRAARLLDVAKATPEALMPAPLRYYGAHTGRFSGEWRLNLQNLPRSSPLRKAVKAKPGRKFVVFDFAQIEARILGWLAGQDDLVSQFAAREDVYSAFASSVYGVKVSKQDNPHLRHIGKICILSLGYGAGAVPLRAALNAQAAPSDRVTLDTAQFLVSAYRQRMGQIAALWRSMDYMLELIVSGVDAAQALKLAAPPGSRIADVLRAEPHPVTSAVAFRLPNDMWVQYRDLRRSDNGFDYMRARGRVTLYGAKFVENVTQALARVIMTDALRRTLASCADARFVFSLHDSVILDVDEASAEAAAKRIRELMIMRPAWASDLPLEVEGGVFGELP